MFHKHILFFLESRTRNFSSDSSSSEASFDTSYRGRSRCSSESRSSSQEPVKKNLENRSRAKQHKKNKNGNKEKRNESYRSRSRQSSVDRYARESLSKSSSPEPVKKKFARESFSRSSNPTETRICERPLKRTNEPSRYRERSSSRSPCSQTEKSPEIFPTVSLVLQTVQKVMVAVQLKRDAPGHMIIICVYLFE